MAGRTPRHPNTHTPTLLLTLLCVLGASAVNFPPARAQSRSEFVPTFSTSPRIRQQVDRLQRLAAQKFWDEWLATYQGLVNEEEAHVLTRDDEFLVGLRYHLHGMLAGQAVAVRQRYRALYDVEARRHYEKAAAEKDSAQMREVYSRYRFSASGPRALQWLADHALDEGRSEIARVAYSRLAKEPGVGVSTLLRYALAAHAAGQPQEAAAVLERVRKEMGGQPAQVAGNKMTAAAAADQVAKSLKAGPPAEAHAGWPSFAGENGDRRMRGTVTGGLKRLWDFPIPANASIGSGSSRIGSPVLISSSGLRSRFSFLSFPALQGERVLIQGPRSLTALRLENGEAAWEQQGFFLGRDEQPMDNTNARTGGRNPPSVRPVQAAPSLDGRVLVSRLPLAVGEREVGRWPVDLALAAFDARTGRQLWRRLAGGEPRGLFFNVPTIQGNVVFSGIATFRGGITEYSVVALDAATGETLWTTYLGAGSDSLDLMDGSPAAVRDGVVWIESSLYTLNAVDLLTGEIRWIYRYTPTRRGSFGGGFNSTPPITNEPISVIGFAGRRKVDGKLVSPVVFAPRWGGKVVMLDGETGTLRWEAAKAESEREAGWLFGLDDVHAYTCSSDGIRAINIGDDARNSPPGLRDWDWSLEVSGNSGYPALAGDRIYVPMEGKVLVLSAADRKELETLDVSEGVGDNPGFSTVLVAGRNLLVTTRDRLVVFGPKE